MHGHGLRPAIGVVLASLAVGALVAAGAANGGAGCAAKASQRASSISTGTSALQTYDDYIEDVQSAPDICAMNLVTNDNESITMAMHIHDRSAFAAGETYSIAFDTDSNAATGGGADSGATAGAEYVIDLANEVATLRKWSGASFDPVAPQREIFTAWIEGLGPFVDVARADLGDAQGFNFTLITSNGVDTDLAPDAGGWSYTLTPLALRAGQLLTGPAKAGKPFVAHMLVVRSDFDIPLSEGAIACRARIGGKPLAGRGAFVRDRVACTWKVPKSARGKQLRGSIAVTLQGATANRAFSVRVT